MKFKKYFVASLMFLSSLTFGYDFNHFPFPTGSSVAGSYFSTASGGTANAQTATTISGDWTNTAGYSVNFKSSVTNTGSTTLSVDGATAKTVIKYTANGGTANLSGGEIVSGYKYTALYDGANFVLVQNFIRGGKSVTAGSTYAITKSDGQYGGEIIYTDNSGAATTFNLPAFSTIDGAWQVTLAAQPNDSITLVPNGLDTIDNNNASVNISGGSVVHLYATGAGFYSPEIFILAAIPANPIGTGIQAYASGGPWTTLNIGAGLKYDGTGATNTLSSATLVATSGSIGGSALLAGACTSGATTVTGATTAMVALADPNTYPGDGIVWDAQVTAANTVTTKVCAILALTPTASTYNIRVIP